MTHYNNTCGVPPSSVSRFTVQGCIPNQKVSESLSHNSLKSKDFWDVTPCSLVSKIFPVLNKRYTMKTCGGDASTAPLLMTSALDGQFHAPTALPPGTDPPVFIGQEAGWAPDPVRTLWRKLKPVVHCSEE